MWNIIINKIACKACINCIKNNGKNNAKRQEEVNMDERTDPDMSYHWQG